MQRLTLSAGSIFVPEGLLTYIYFLLFEENHQNRISRAGEKLSPTISLFFHKMTDIRPLAPVQNSVSLKLMQRKTLNFVINLPGVENITK